MVVKITDQVKKPFEQVLDFYICKMTNNSEAELLFVPGKGTTDAILVACQL